MQVERSQTKPLPSTQNEKVAKLEVWNTDKSPGLLSVKKKANHPRQLTPISPPSNKLTPQQTIKSNGEEVQKVDESRNL
jgi:hypothetical protein